MPAGPNGVVAGAETGAATGVGVEFVKLTGSGWSWLKCLQEQTLSRTTSRLQLQFEFDLSLPLADVPFEARLRLSEFRAFQHKTRQTETRKLE